MTRRAMEAVIGRAALDEAFRGALFADPDAALAGYPLTDGELAGLRAIDVESLEYFAASPGIVLALQALTDARPGDDAGFEK